MNKQHLEILCLYSNALNKGKLFTADEIKEITVALCRFNGEPFIVEDKHLRFIYSIVSFFVGVCLTSLFWIIIYGIR